MKEKRLLIGFILLSIIASFSIASATCSPAVTLVNQDPYPANPGDYVKLVFQVNGIADSDCETVSLTLKEKFPISFDPGANSTVSVKSGFYNYDYGSFLSVPFKVLVSKDAVDGDNPIETSLAYRGAKEMLDNFTLSIKEMKVDFDIHVKNYDFSTNMLTLEILNLGKIAVSAIAITIPPQENIRIKGPNKNIVGDLDSNEYTTADFEVSGSGNMNLEISYTDAIDVRRSINKTINFDPLYFQDRKADEKKVSPVTYIIIAAVVIIIVLWIYRSYKRRKHKRLVS